MQTKKVTQVMGLLVQGSEVVLASGAVKMVNHISTVRRDYVVLRFEGEETARRYLYSGQYLENAEDSIVGLNLPSSLQKSQSE